MSGQLLRISRIVSLIAAPISMGVTVDFFKEYVRNKLNERNVI
jgi:hypothetical protein